MPNKDKEVCFVKFTKGSLNRIVHIFVRVIHSKKKTFASYSASRAHTCYSNYKKNHFWNERGGQGLSAYGAVVCKLYLIRSHVSTHLNFSLSTKSVSLTLKPKRKNRGLIGLKLECYFDAKCLPTSRNLSISDRPWIWICYSGGANTMSKD